VVAKGDRQWLAKGDQQWFGEMKTPPLIGATYSIFAAFTSINERKTAQTVIMGYRHHPASTRTIRRSIQIQ
jgi:hypothetical protein